MFTKLDYIFISLFAVMCFLILIFGISYRNLKDLNNANAKLDSLLQEKEIIYVPVDTFKYDSVLIINPYK